MGIRILEGDYEGQSGACMVDSTGGVVFGPLFKSGYDAVSFLEYAIPMSDVDLRTLSSSALDELYQKWTKLPECSECDGKMAEDDISPDGRCSICAESYEP